MRLNCKTSSHRGIVSNLSRRGLFSHLRVRYCHSVNVCCNSVLYKRCGVPRPSVRRGNLLKSFH